MLLVSAVYVFITVTGGAGKAFLISALFCTFIRLINTSRFFIAVII